jgi:hypothetical protein
MPAFFRVFETIYGIRGNRQKATDERRGEVPATPNQDFTMFGAFQQPRRNSNTLIMAVASFATRLAEYSAM